MSRYLWNNHAPQPRGNQSPWAGNGSTCNCMTCNRWRPIAGSAINPRTRQWQCAGCKPVRLTG